MPPIKILVALADPTRCRLIEILHEGPQPVHVLAAAFKISRPAISRHLRVLKQAGLISEKKLGRENRYALHAHRLAPVQRWLAEVLPAAKTAAVAESAVVVAAPEPVVVPAPEPIAAAPVKLARVKPAAKAKPEAPVAKPAASPRPSEPAAVSQMGFDF
ncbi:metalloregulator ArsR/SmtB family transcription factor [Devosia sp. FKR38]|uniref:ArsR/SmtB family transcription factor n=1 Tax=Devosia sp. FKR38 TaxID=2562312 RepID=UPI0010BFD466|nr:metalloregulator ArsR/SmtB family transcription factor [Devosia sp. FKR38]